MSNGAPSGKACFSCHRARQVLVDARMAAKRRASPVGQFERTEARARALQNLLGPDGDAAVRLGAHVLNQEAEAVGEKLAEAVEDPAHEFHRKALALVANRILPLKVYGEAAAHLTRSGETAGASDKPAPSVTVHVRVTTGPKW